MHEGSKMEAMCDANKCIEAFMKCKKGTIWKESVQRYEINLLRNVKALTDSVRDGTWAPKPFNEFTISERGKTRDIKAVRIEDRVALRNYCDNILYPCVQKSLAYDNGAALKGKGISFTRRRLETHLHKYYRKQGTNKGYILLMDFSKFFDNIRHDKLMEEFSERLQDPDAIAFMGKLMKQFEIDVSYLTDEEYKYCMGALFNSLEHSAVDKSLLTGEKMMEKSVGIGSPVSQIAGLLYPTRIDNYCKIVMGAKYYGRYMDDIYVIHHDRAFLESVLQGVGKICAEYGIFLNEKKTHIARLDRTFTFLKVRYDLTGTGRVVKRPNKGAITRERRKLKKFREMLDSGEMEYPKIEEQYKSWRGNYNGYSAHYAMMAMDKLYNELFIKPFIEGRDYYGRIDKGLRGNGSGRA